MKVNSINTDRLIIRDVTEDDDKLNIIYESNVYKLHISELN